MDYIAPTNFRIHSFLLPSVLRHRSLYSSPNSDTSLLLVGMATVRVDLAAPPDTSRGRSPSPVPAAPSSAPLPCSKARADVPPHQNRQPLPSRSTHRPPMCTCFLSSHSKTREARASTRCTPTSTAPLSPGHTHSSILDLCGNYPVILSFLSSRTSITLNQ
jgi:hypothetical protein